MFNKTLMSCFMATMLVSANLQSMEIDRSNLFAKNELGNIRVFHDDEGKFCILKDDEVIPVQGCFIDRRIRNINNEQLDSLLGNLKTVPINGESITLKRIPAHLLEGIKITICENQPTEEENEDMARQLSSMPNYLQIGQMDSGEYSIRYKMRLTGGGPFSAAIGYWVTKAVCYSSAAAVAGAAVAATGIATIAGAGAGGAAAAGAGGTALVATGIAATGGAVVAGIETASSAVAAVLFWLPLP